MTADEAKGEIYKAFDTAYANYIIEALTNGATCSDKGEPLGNAPWRELQPVDFCATCERVATLQAKVYVYEKIIANSNFAPMVQDKPREEEHKVERKTERAARWILHTIENDHSIVCSNCMNVLLTYVGYKSKEEARQAAKDGIECGAIKTTNYCSCCGARMEVDI